MAHRREHSEDGSLSFKYSFSFLHPKLDSLLGLEIFSVVKSTCAKVALLLYEDVLPPLQRVLVTEDLFCQML